MQLANSAQADPALRRRVRPATRDDAGAIQRLMRLGVYIHTHVDWRPPGDWLGTPGFVVAEAPGAARGRQLAGCMAIGADPLPAAWVRVAAVDSAASFPLAQAMHAAIVESLEPGIDEIAWFLTDNWPQGWLDRLGFSLVSRVLVYHKEGVDSAPFRAPAGLDIRPVLLEEMDALAAIEEAAFEPRWRHSATALGLAWRQSISFDVALMDGEPVGFQFSTGGGGRAHLARMTVRPDWQGQGVGAALLAHALDGYERRRVRTVGLNTQSDNMASRRLYERFGFVATGYEYPVWSIFREPGQSTLLPGP